MDSLSKGLSPSARIRFCLADVTVAAKALEARHLSGPTASAAMAEGLLAAALISPDATRPDETVLVRVRASGPLKGLVAEATGAGHLRGFTHIKILNDLDGAAEIQTAPAWGEDGVFETLTSIPGKVLNRVSLNVVPFRMQQALARYFNFSAQIPTGVHFTVRADSGGILHARGLIVQKMPDSDSGAFASILERMEDPTVHGLLQNSSDKDCVASALQCPDLEWRETRTLQFQCRCSQEKILSVLKTLDATEIEDLITRGKGQEVVCHMCGKNYTASTADLRRILDTRRSETTQHDTPPTPPGS